ncbi:hypothetical protein EWE75_23210 [Sphingomonas populi]|uniref:Uncharacterized protein n=1 Tax=Sphingomonas populi TaxID=2484750 RepID=A0A4Q6XR45_9SPHN|nr:DUF6683 family protein [Sphingomonas populi]RZF59159.1 hypothetical protein EWE75_23210 [Sphingomonas populi]
MSRFLFLIASMLCVALGATSPAAAQGVFNPGTLTVSLGMDVNTQAEERRARTGRFDEPAPRHAARVNLTYRPDAARRHKNFARFVAKASQIDPADGAQVKQMITGQDVIGKLQAAIRPYGMSINNVADAAAVYLAFAWLATRAEDRDPTRAEMTGLRTQMAAAMAASPAFATASDAVKQEMAEGNLVQGLIVGKFGAMAKKNPALRPKVRALVAQGAKSAYGFDLLSLSLTAHGLRQ